MKAGWELNPEIHQAVALYALGALDETAKAEFELHLERGCEPCQAELRLLNAVTDEFAIGAALPAPEQLRQRVLAQARTARIPGQVFREGGLLVSRSSEVAWRTISSGIEYKPLSVDPKRDNHTLLVRMEPGARYSAHRHADIEELFMLSGDLQVAGQVVRGGDYCRAEAGTVHGESFSESGCVFLLIASRHDERLGA